MIESCFYIDSSFFLYVQSTKNLTTMLENTDILDAQSTQADEYLYPNFSWSAIVTPLQVWGGCLLLGMFAGISTNMVNGLVSPLYFNTILHWNLSPIETWAAAIMQGLLEGFIYGFFLGFVYSFFFVIITKWKGKYRLFAAIFFKALKIIYAFWGIAGLAAIVLSLICWDTYDNLIIGVPQPILPRVGYAWVGGSIWGAMVGGVISLLYLMVQTYQRLKTKI